MKKPKLLKEVQVMKGTIILVDQDIPDEVAKRNWLNKYNQREKVIDEQQKRREIQTIRTGKLEQRKNYK